MANGNENYQRDRVGHDTVETYKHFTVGWAVSWQQRISWQENERTHEALCKSSSDYIANSCTNIAQVKDGTWAYYRRMKTRLGASKAITATAHNWLG